MLYPNTARVFSIIVMLLFSCKTAQVNITSLTELEANNTKKVSLEELLRNKGKYHGQFIETEGFFHSGAEERAIYFDTDVYIDGKAVTKYRVGCGLWLEFNYHYTPSNSRPDSLLVAVKGFFDTTKTGHVGGCYYATLTNTYHMKVVDGAR